MKRLIHQVLPWALLAAALIPAILSIAPAAPESGDYQSGYQPERAFATLEKIAREPRPVGSAAHAAMRSYLFEELEKTGSTVEVQAGQGGGLNLQNFFVRLRGEASTGTVLLMAHYDSVSRSPGAGDDGAGVVALLEALHVLAEEPRRNDVCFLFTDGEERGLLGAKLFAQQSPIFDEVEVVINFEAIGNAGPAVLFETGPGSGGLIELFGEAVPSPAGNSLMSVIYSWMPNDTDLSIFRDAGKRGLNFAIAGASGFYHSPADGPEAFNKSSLAHMGDTAVLLARRLGEVDLASLDREPRTFVSAEPLGFFVWEGSLHATLALAVLIITALALWRRRLLRPLALLRGILGATFLAGSAGGAAYALATLGLDLLHPATPLTFGEVNALIFALILFAWIGATLWCKLWSLGRSAQARRTELLLGSLCLWSALFAAFLIAEFSAPGASFVFAVGITCLSLATALRLLFDAPPWLVALSLVPAIFLLSPLLSQLVQLGSQSLGGAVGIGSITLSLGTLLLAPALCPRPHLSKVRAPLATAPV